MMTQPSVPRAYIWFIGGLAATVAAIVAVSDGRAWFVSPGRLIALAALVLFTINMLVVSANLILTVRGSGKSRTDEELEAQVVRAIRDNPQSLPPVVVRYVTLLVVACVGVLLGAVMAALIRSV